MVITTLISAILTAAAVSIATIPPTIWLAKRYGFVDDPKIHRHPAIVHQNTVPRAGGIPIFLGLIVPVLLFLPLTKQLIGLLLGALSIVLVGTLDDKYDLHPYLRFATNLLAASLVISVGIGISFITNPLGGILHLSSPIAALFALLWIPWVMNMLNWSKGVDGQMPGIVVIAAITIGLLALKTINTEPGQLTTAIVSFSLAGAALGFLLFNWYPARIFPGYGATVTGFTLAVLSIYSSSKVATALLVLGIPTVDALFTLTRRILAKKNPFLGDREHLHHRLLDLGWSHQQIALFYWSFCAMLGVAALTLSSQGKIFAVIGVLLVVGGGLLWLRSVLGSSKVYDQGSG